MRRVAVVALAATLFAAAPSLAQQQPYAGVEARPLEGAVDEQIADLKAARGSGSSVTRAARMTGSNAPKP